jgi:glucosamine-6-phosphate deaminase
VRGRARVILATGNSQVAFLEALTAVRGIDWRAVTVFHMDEYLGLTPGHPASFRRYMREKVAARVPLGAFEEIEGDALEPIYECDRYGELLDEAPIDLVCLGIGENGHLAFNDPPVADFNDQRAAKIVKLDEACRRQQVGEGHFPTLDAVPQYALTLTIPRLLRAEKMICVVPEARKAAAVRDALQGPRSHACPASILRAQKHATLYLDLDSASAATCLAGERA